VSGPITIRPISPERIGEAVAIDDDACTLFATVGVHLDMSPDHPFARAEYARWTQAAQDGAAFLAERTGGPAVGLLVLGRVDGVPYLDQLSVRTAAMRQGIGRRLVWYAIAWAAGADLWLTTYAHVPWNRSYYERLGFAVVPEPQCRDGIRAILAEQQRWLPAPEQRVAMLRTARYLRPT